MAYADVNNISLYYETFGAATAPAVLLISGAGGQCISWPDTFCTAIAEAGYRVIRFDNRDIGLSTYIDFEKTPYDLNVMLADTLGLLDHLNIKQAHVLGCSMGGFIAQEMAIQAPERMLSMVSLISTPDHTPMCRAFAKESLDDQALMPPYVSLLKLLDEFFEQPPETPEANMAAYLALMHALSDNRADIDDAHVLAQRNAAINRIKGREDFTLVNHHLEAMTASRQNRCEALQQVQVPTLIIHAALDALFPIDHGEFMAQIMPNAGLFVLDDVGHCLTQGSLARIQEEVLKHFNQA